MMLRRLGLRALALTIAGGVLGASMASEASGQDAPPTREQAFALLGELVGSWEGAVDGSLGTGTGVREYELILDGQFLMWRQASVRLPQDRSPEGDHHRELGVFSFDSERGHLVLREFMVEGVVDQYACEVDGRTIRCVTEHVESGPDISAQLTLEIHDAFRFEESFELSLPGNAEPIRFHIAWTRVPSLP